jgi:CHAT domain-containing protein
MTYNNIGICYRKKEDYEKALEYYFKSLEIRINKLGENNPNVAQSYFNIGNVYTDMKNYDKSLEYQLKGLKIYKLVYEDENIYIADCYLGIGNNYALKNEFENALKYFNKNLAINKKVLGEKNINSSKTYNSMGNLYFNNKDYKMSLKNYNKSIYNNILTNFDTTNILNLPQINKYMSWNELLISIDAKARIFANVFLPIEKLENTNRFEIALKHYQSCDTLITKTRKNIFSKNDKLNLMQKSHKIYCNAIDVCLNLAIENKTNNSYFYIKQAFLFSEKSKIRILTDDIAEKNTKKSIGFPDSLLQIENKLIQKISYLKDVLYQNTDTSKILNLKGNIFYLERELENLNNVFYNLNPDYFNLLIYNKLPELSEIQLSLENNTAILSYSIIDTILFLFTITNQNTVIDKVVLPNNFSKILIDYSKSLSNIDKSNNIKFVKQSEFLFNLLFTNNIKSIQNIENLIIVPDDSLSLLPFETLLTEHYMGDINKMQDYPFLIKKYNITYSPSVSFWFQNTSNNYDKNMKDIALFAPINFETDTFAVEKTDIFDTDFSSRNIYLRYDINKKKYYSPLENTKVETDEIFKLFSKNKGVKYQYKSATEYNFKNIELNKFKIIHLATHAVVSDNKNLLSGIIFSNDTLRNEDGFLSEREIYNLKLNAKLVVLSACETAKGEVYKGEGVMSLTRAFIFAGADNVIATLWNINDKKSAELMIDFYRYYLKKDYSIDYALRLAKLDMIKKGGSYSHPLYWSAYILVGKK